MTAPRPEEIEWLRSIVRHLDTSDCMSDDQKRTCEQRFKDEFASTFSNMVSTGKTYGQSTGVQDIYSLSQGDFFSYLRNIDNDLGAQIKQFSLFVDRWFQVAEHPPPHFTWRITVILRKAKLFELEREFLAAYFKHFWTERGSSRDRDLGRRAVKIGISIPSIPDSSPPPWVDACSAP